MDIIKGKKLNFVLRMNKEELRESDIMDVLRHHDALWKKYAKLQRYYEGDHDILYRKKDKDLKNNKIVSNLAGYIVKVATGYFTGNPISYTAQDDSLMEAVQDIIDNNDDADNLSRLAKYVFTKKHAFEIVYTDEEANLKYNVEEPENMIMIYNLKLSEEPTFAIRRYREDELNVQTDKEYIEVYSKFDIKYYIREGGMLTLIEEVPHYFNELPVIEYYANDERMGLFEDHIHIIDAYNKSQSDTMNDIEYFAEAYLALVGMQGTEEEDIENLKENRVMLLDEQGQAFFITKPVNDAHLENYKNRLKDDLFTGTMTPDITDESFSGNTSGIALRYKLWGLEQIASTAERKFRKSLRHRMRLIVTYLNHKGNNYDYRQLEYQFKRNIPIHVKEEAETLKILRGNVCDETAYGQMSFIEDPLYEKQKMEEEKQANIDAYMLGVDEYDDATDNEGSREAASTNSEERQEEL